MTDELVYHEVTPIGRGLTNIYEVTVYRGGELVDVDLDTGEATFAGGTPVATLYRRHLGEAHKAGIDYSFRCAR